jgi:hypothetical protein
MSEAIADDLERRLSHLLAAACSALRQPEEWRAVRHAWLPGAPVTTAHLGEAAHPAEVREVLVALHAAYAARLPPEAPGESEAMRDFRRRRLADFVRAETESYIARVTPRPDVRSLFDQAASRGRPAPAAEGGAAPSVTAGGCRRCGAPRQTGTVYGRCAFCGTDFFA